MTKEREALKLALEALEEPHPGIRTSFCEAMDYREKVKQAITAIKKALAQPEQEPVATVQCIRGVTIGYLDVMQPVGTRLYTAPPKRQPLTEERINLVTVECFGPNADLDFHCHHARAIEAAHGIKEAA